MTFKDLIDFAKCMANNSNPKVRSASTDLICILYKTYGSSVRAAIKDIKDSTLKIIDAELDKIQLSPEQQENINNNMQNIKVPSKNDEKENKKQEIVTGPVNPQDISKKITKELLKDIDEGKWVEKKDILYKKKRKGWICCLFPKL